MDKIGADSDIKIKVFCYIIIVFFIVHYLYFVAVTGYKGIGGDFSIYNKHAENLLELKKYSSYEEIHKLLTKDRDVVYFPLFYLSLIPLFKLGFYTASVIWLILNQLAFLFSLCLLIKTIKHKLSLVEFALVVFMVTNFLAVEFNIIAGQTNFLVLLSLAGCLYYLGQKKEITAGIFLSFSIFLKWVPLLLLIFLLWKKKYRCVISALLFIIFMFLISIFRFGLKAHYIQLIRVIPDSIHVYSGKTISHSLCSVFQRLFRQDLVGTQGIIHSPFLANFFGWACVLLFLILSLKKLLSLGRNITDKFQFEFAFFVCLLLLISSWVHIYHLVWALIPFLIAFLNIEKIKRWIWIFIVSFLLLGLEYWPDGLSIFSQGWGVIFLSGRAIGMVLLWIGYFLILSEKNEDFTNIAIAN